MFRETAASESTLDLSEAMRNLDGDAELLREIMELFLDTASDQLDSIASYIAGDHVGQVAIQAHGLKGSAANLCAIRFVAAAQALEQLAKQGTLAGAAERLADMRAALEELREVVAVVNWQEIANQWNG